MREGTNAGPLIARCAVCRGDIHQQEPHDVWEGGYYCERHALPLLRERARRYGEMIRESAPKT